MRYLLKYLGKHKGLLALALLCATINQVFSLFDPFIMGKYIIDPFAKSPHFKIENGIKIPRGEDEFIRGILFGLSLLVGTAMVSRIGKAFQDYLVNVVIQKFGANIYQDGLKHALGLPFNDFEDQRSGETLSILQKVRIDCEKLITSFVNVLFTTIIGIIFVMGYAYSLSSWLVIVYLSGALCLSFLTSYLSKKIKVVQKRIVSETTALAGSTTESLRNIELVKTLGLTNQEIERLNNNTNKILELELSKVKSLRAISFVQGTFVNFLRQCIMFMLLYFVFKDVLTLGQMVTMQFYSFFIFGPLQEIGNIILAYREAEASMQNFQVLMAKPLEKVPENAEDLGNIQNISFNNIHFQHRTASSPAIDGISLEINAGETVAFVGPSGSGKTTLVKIITGLYQPNSGTVSYNNITSDHIKIEQLRQQIGIVTQDPQLFSGTIKENLLFVKPDATEEEIHEALQKSAANNLLSRAEHGIHTKIGEGGLRLSGGERQRISIARALLRKPNLLIFDEATSALDSITEEEITQTVNDISASRKHIIVMIAHRLSTIMNADRIYVLERGKIAEVGTHQQLVDQKGLYYAMWRQQIGERQRIAQSI